MFYWSPIREKNGLGVLFAVTRLGLPQIRFKDKTDYYIEPTLGM